MEVKIQSRCFRFVCASVQCVHPDSGQSQPFEAVVAVYCLSLASFCLFLFLSLFIEVSSFPVSYVRVSIVAQCMLCICKRQKAGGLQRPTEVRVQLVLPLGRVLSLLDPPSSFTALPAG